MVRDIQYLQKFSRGGEPRIVPAARQSPLFRPPRLTPPPLFHLLSRRNPWGPHHFPLSLAGMHDSGSPSGGNLSGKIQCHPRSRFRKSEPARAKVKSGEIARFPKTSGYYAPVSLVCSLLHCYERRRRFEKRATFYDERKVHIRIVKPSDAIFQKYCKKCSRM